MTPGFQANDTICIANFCYKLERCCAAAQSAPFGHERIDHPWAPSDRFVHPNDACGDRPVAVSEIVLFSSIYKVPATLEATLNVCCVAFVACTLVINFSSGETNVTGTLRALRVSKGKQNGESRFAGQRFRDEQLR